MWTCKGKASSSSNYFICKGVSHFEGTSILPCVWDQQVNSDSVLVNKLQGKILKFSQMHYPWGLLSGLCNFCKAKQGVIGEMSTE